MSEVEGVILDGRRPTDGRLWVQDSARPLGTIINFTSMGDDTSSQTYIGGGSLGYVVHNISDSTDQPVYMDFNVKENRTFIHAGKCTWQDSTFDTLCLGVVPALTPYTDGTNTNFNLYSGLIVPAAGTGTIAVNPANLKLVEMVNGLDYGDPKPGYWNADYDSTTHSFSNLSAAPLGNGRYNLFGSEVCLGTFVNRILLLGNSSYDFMTKDTFEIGHNMRIKLLAHTRGTDHGWRASIVLAVYRAKVTVNNMNID